MAKILDIPESESDLFSVPDSFVSSFCSVVISEPEEYGGESPVGRILSPGTSESDYF